MQIELQRKMVGKIQGHRSGRTRNQMREESDGEEITLQERVRIKGWVKDFG